jgi:hypothetical protein
MLKSTLSTRNELDLVRRHSTSARHRRCMISLIVPTLRGSGERQVAGR